jgi:GT2 family glycosyltransferase
MPKFLAPPPLEDLEPGPVPSFSVVIPAFQAAATIAEAVSSVLAQTMPAAEIIVCDDGSTDELDEALAGHREAIELLRLPHRGVAATRNSLLRAAQGDFIVPLDADDVYAPTRLQRMSELAVARPDLDLLATDALLVAGDGRPMSRFAEGTPFAVERQEKEILRRCFLICPGMRRQRLLAIGGYDEELSSAEDWDCYIRLIQAGAVAGLVDEPLLEYRLGAGSLTGSRSETLRERVRVLEKAASAPGPRERERRTARQALAFHRARALEHEAREAVLSDDPRARRHLLAVARSSEVRPRRRAFAMVAAAAPGIAKRPVKAILAESKGRPV